MDIVNSLETAERVIDTVTRISMHNWNKRSIITLVIATAAIASVTVAIHIIKDKKKGVEIIDNQTV